MCTRTVLCSEGVYALAYWNNIIATGFMPCDITIFNALTGSQTAVLSGHTSYVRSLAFSLDGALLVSGSDDKTVKLWDVQTGGVVKTFHGHTLVVCSVSISADNTMIASGSADKTIRLWDIRKGQCCVIVSAQNMVAKILLFSSSLTIPSLHFPFLMPLRLTLMILLMLSLSLTTTEQEKRSYWCMEGRTATGTTSQEHVLVVEVTLEVKVLSVIGASTFILLGRRDKRVNHPLRRDLLVENTDQSSALRDQLQGQN